jgi:anthranilate 1,2-dioxygenase large subunit/terephthalate 1,2-dioxygenase oxygenase component alpha subunit
MIVSPNGGCHVSESFAPTASNDQSYAGMRSVDEDFKLEDPSLMDVIDEHPDRVRHQIVSTFPNLVLQKTQNIMTLRSFAPVSVDSTHLHWFYLGYADDTLEMRKRRLRQLNIGGPAGFASMEDGCVGGFVERGIATAEDASSIVKMGGVGIESQATRATESSVRGFWSLWRGMMGV